MLRPVPSSATTRRYRDPGRRAGRRANVGVPAVAGLGSALESGHHLRGLSGRRPHGPGRPSGRSTAQTGLARVPPPAVGGDRRAARAVLRLAATAPHQIVAPILIACVGGLLLGWPIFGRGQRSSGLAELEGWAAFPNGTFWVLPIAGALIGPAGTAIAALTNAVYAIPNALCIHLMRRDAPIRQRRSTSWLDQSMVLAVVLGLALHATGPAPPHRSGS